MDQELKQRLVGAVVITSLAVIFIPMLFDDPAEQSAQATGRLEIPSLADAGYEFDQTVVPKSVAEVVQRPKPRVIKQIQAKKKLNKMERWYVQLGTFGSSDNASTLKDKIRKQGFHVNVNKITTTNGLMYRVVVGPELDRKRAEQLKVKIDKLNSGLKSILSLNDG